MTGIESKVIKRGRFGSEGGEIVALCEIFGESNVCVGVGCSMYQECWKDLNPDEEGYFTYIPSLNPN
jgi:hypothetical protein